MGTTAAIVCHALQAAWFVKGLDGPAARWPVALRGKPFPHDTAKHLNYFGVTRGQPVSGPHGHGPAERPAPGAPPPCRVRRRGAKLHSFSVFPQRRHPAGHLGVRCRSPASDPWPARMVPDGALPGRKTAVCRRRLARRPRRAPNISAPCPRCSSRWRRCRIRWGCWSSAARSCPSPQQMRRGGFGGACVYARARSRARDGRSRSAGRASRAASGILARCLVDDVVRGAGNALHRREPAVRRRPHIGLAPRSTRAHGRPLRLLRRRLSRAGAAHPHVGCSRARGGRTAPRARRDCGHGHDIRPARRRRW